MTQMRYCKDAKTGMTEHSERPCHTRMQFVGLC